MPGSIRNTAVACKLIFSVADPDPGYGAFLTPRSGMDKKSGSGFRMISPDHISFPRA
jgi:hypothetical protein